MGVADVVGVYQVGMECVVLVDNSQQDGLADCDGGADYKSPTGMRRVFCWGDVYTWQALVVWLTCTVMSTSRLSPRLIKGMAMIWILSTG